MSLTCDSVILSLDNEMHDCQRLVRRLATRPALEFGPLLGIFPNQWVLNTADTIYDTPQLVARISNAGSMSGDNGYPPLRIDGGPPGSLRGYCLWLHNDVAGRRGWIAGLTGTEDPLQTNARCTQPPDSAGWNLSVVRQTYREAELVNYPNTARWQWNHETQQHYMGVKCGAAWCSIGPPGFAPQPIDQREEDARRAIPGWHDAQFLAREVRVDGMTRLVPGPWAVVYPLSLPDSLYDDPVNSAWNEFQEVARVEVLPQSAVFTGGFESIGPYDAKFNLNLADFPRMYSTIEIRLPPSDPAADEARYRSSSGARRPSMGVRRGPTQHGPARAARFRWHSLDETIWIPCPVYGCCDVEEDGG